MSTNRISRSYSGSPHSHFDFTSFVTTLRNRWQDYRLMRSLEAVPFEVMKDVGYPAVVRANEM